MKSFPGILISMSFVAMLFSVSCRQETGKTNGKSFPASYLEEMTISRLHQGYMKGEFTVHRVVSDYIERINAIDKNGPCLNSVITINPDALVIADSLDKVLKHSGMSGPLFGVPVMLKDNIDTHDKMPNTGGSRALARSFPATDSYVAARLRMAGAIIIAKANLSEWANFRSTSSSSGWSGIAGQTRNPYVLDRNPCGSSSGSAVAVSANLCMTAIGTETNGSVVCPSNNNGIVGIKPTVGLISRSGIIPISFSQDTPGPMARTVEDAVRMLGPLTGIDERDSKTSDSRGLAKDDYTPFLKSNGLSGKRIGLLRDMMGFNRKVDTIISRAVRDMEMNGAEVIDVRSPSRGYSAASYQVMLYEFKDGINRYLSSLDSSIPYRTLDDLIEFNSRDSVELRWFGQEIFEAAREKGGLESQEYKIALERMHQASRRNGIDRLLREYNLDALIAPTGSPAWKTDLILGDHFTGGSSSLAAIAGYPSITVPAGFIEGLPVGISFFGTAWSEPVLIEIAYGYEQATMHRRPPQFRTSD